jgi:hypothetical protein
MLLKFFQRYHCDGRQQYFAKKIHTQMCITSLFGKVIDNENQHRKVLHEWNDDDDEQKKIFYEEEINKSLLEKSNQQSKNKCVEKKPDKPETYIIYYEGGVGIVSR